MWEANENITEDYHVFVHIIDESGNIVVQSDGKRANWTRPTAGWLPGEYIIDGHTIILPSDIKTGSYIVNVGLYNNLNYERLVSDEFPDGSVPITEILYKVN